MSQFSSIFFDYMVYSNNPIEVQSNASWFRIRFPDEQEWEDFTRRLLRSNEYKRDKEADFERKEVALLIAESSSFRPLTLSVRNGTLDVGRFLMRPENSLEQAFFIRGTDSVYRRYRELSRWWDAITLTPQKELVLQALRIIDDRVTDIDFLSQQPNVKVRLRNVETPIYIGSLGDGMRHLLAVALALAQAKDGLLLLDEIETGLHFLTQVDLWRMLFQAAADFNVQIMATTHSYDCIAAFSQVWGESEPTVGRYIRLDNVAGEIVPEFYTVEELMRAVAKGIEMR